MGLSDENDGRFGSKTVSTMHSLVVVSAPEGRLRSSCSHVGANNSSIKLVSTIFDTISSTIYYINEIESEKGTLKHPDSCCSIELVDRQFVVKKW